RTKAGPALGSSRTTADAPTPSSESLSSEPMERRGLAPSQLLNQDVPGRAMAERDARAVHLAKDGAGAGNLGHEGRFAKAHFAHALAELAISHQLTYPPHGASGKLTQRKADNVQRTAH